MTRPKLLIISAALCLLLCLCSCTGEGENTATGGGTAEIPTPPAKTENGNTAAPETDEVSETNAPVLLSGIKNSITVYEDDSADAIRSALLEGVSAEGLQVKVKLLSGDISALSPGDYIVSYYCDDTSVAHVASKLTVRPADKTAPVISGAADMLVELGQSVSYRKGVSVTDNDDESISLSVDASGVDLTKLGTYTVTYSATDRRGNTASVAVKITVISGSGNPVVSGNGFTADEFNALINGILEKIITPDMTDRQKAEAIFNRVNSLKYYNTKEGDDNWTVAAYAGLTTGRGDCQNYAAASKALLTAAGIPNFDLERFGGESHHYWNLVFVEGGWYHFDACPPIRQYYMKLFLLTDEEAIAYSNWRTDKPNYLIYNREKCPYEVVVSRN